jgi:putative DNA primase/helicase
VNVDAIPQELRDRDQWVLWRFEERGGRRTKVPLAAREWESGTRASSTNPETWAPFRAALDCVEIGGVGDGVGFVFSADDPYVGVDLDQGLSEPDRAAILLALDSYSEASVSGGGVHVIVRATLNGRGRNRRGPFEVYERGRFFVVTGEHVRGTPATIEDRQAQLDEVLERFLPKPARPAKRAPAPAAVTGDDSELLELAFAARNGSDLERLYRGDTSGYPSRSEADLALASGLSFWVGPDTARLDRLFRASALMRQKWDSRRGETTYGAQTISRALEGRTEFYSPRGPSSRVSIGDTAAGTGSGGDLGLDDIGNGARFAAAHHPMLRYVPVWQRWLCWDGRRWAEDDALEHLRRAQTTARSLAAEAAAEPDEHRRKELLGHAKRSAAEPRLRAMLTTAGSDPRIVVRPRDLDSDPWLLCVENGVVDLRTGNLRPHQPAELLTKIAGAAYDPAADAPTWHAHLARVLPDPELRAFLQRLTGLSAIGVVREHVLPLLVGGGANGKSSTRNAIAGALGEYAGQSSADLLLRGRRSVGQATPELADLRGLRLVTVSETPEDGQLAGERAKAVTGGDPVTARRLHGNPFTFTPSHTVWVLTNHRPRVPDAGYAMWRRLLLIDFAVTIPPHEQDRDLDAKLAAERPGILRWIVDGARAYLEHGLAPPDSVVQSTDRYRQDEDSFAAFLAESVTNEPDASARASDLLAAHKAWADRAGAPPLTRNSLADKLAAAGYERRRVDTGTRWYGLRLLHEGTLDA